MWRCRLTVCYRRHGRSLLGDNFHSFLQQKAGFSLAKCGQTALGSSYFVFPFFFFFFNTSPRSALRPAPRLHHGLRAVPQRPERGGQGGERRGAAGRASAPSVGGRTATGPRTAPRPHRPFRPRAGVAAAPSVASGNAAGRRRARMSVTQPGPGSSGQSER